MPSRRIKSIMHGSAADTRIYHREHRSSKGRKKNPKGNELGRINREEGKRRSMKFQADAAMRTYNSDRTLRRQTYIKAIINKTQ